MALQQHAAQKRRDQYMQKVYFQEASNYDKVAVDRTLAPDDESYWLNTMFSAAILVGGSFAIYKVDLICDLLKLSLMRFKGLKNNAALVCELVFFLFSRLFHA